MRVVPIRNAAGKIVESGGGSHMGFSRWDGGKGAQVANYAHVD